MPVNEHLGSYRYQDWVYQPESLLVPEGSDLQFASKEKISRREFLQRMGLLGIGLIAGFETAQFTQIPDEVFLAAFQHQINDYKVVNPQPISLGTFGGTSRIPATQRALGTTFDRQFEFLTWHKGDEYLDRKMNQALGFMHAGRIPGFSWSLLNQNGKRPFTYGSHAYYDQEHKAYLRFVAEKIRDTHIPIELTFLEPNLRREPPDKFGDLVRYVVKTFRDVGAHNAIFSLYVSAQFPLTLPYAADYYPGHGWIDKFGISLYDLYLESLFAFHHWFPGNQGPIRAAWPWLQPILDVTDRKTQVIIAETGSGRKNYYNGARWMLELIQFCQSIGINELNIFNVNFAHKYTGDMPETLLQEILGTRKGKINLGERDWAVNTNESKLQAYTDVFSGHEDLFDPADTLESRMKSLAESVQRDSFITPTSLGIARKIDKQLRIGLQV